MTHLPRSSDCTAGGRTGRERRINPMMLAVAAHALIPEACCKLAAYEQLIHQKMNFTNVAIECLRIPKDGQHTTRILSLITTHHVPFYVRGREERCPKVSRRLCATGSWLRAVILLIVDKIWSLLFPNH